jgi:hypothetical protein
MLRYVFNAQYVLFCGLRQSESCDVLHMLHSVLVSDYLAVEDSAYTSQE